MLSGVLRSHPVSGLRYIPAQEVHSNLKAHASNYVLHICPTLVEFMKVFVKLPKLVVEFSEVATLVAVALIATRREKRNLGGSPAVILPNALLYAS